MNFQRLIGILTKSQDRLFEDIVNMVAFTLTRNTAVVMNRLGLARKQYYSRMDRLIDGGLVMRKSSKYFLTSFGKVVYESQMLIGQAIENYWIPKAIDSIEASPPDHDLSAEERKRIIDALIESSNIKNILLNHKIPSGQDDKISNEPTISNIGAIPTTH